MLLLYNIYIMNNNNYQLPANINIPFPIVDANLSNNLQNSLQNNISDLLTSLTGISIKKDGSKGIGDNDSSFEGKKQKALETLSGLPNKVPGYGDYDENNVYTLACRAGKDVIALKYLQENEYDPSHETKDGYTALMLACKNKLVKSANYLIDTYEEKCNITHSTSNRLPALHYALINGMKEFALKLLNKFGPDIKPLDMDYHGNDSLFVALHTGCFKVVDYLFDNYNDIDLQRIYSITIKPSIKSKTTLLAYASKKKYEDIIERIIDMDTNCYPGYITSSKDTALLWLCYNHLPELAHKLLIKYGSDCRINAIDSAQHDALFYACSYNQIIVVNELLSLNPIMSRIDKNGDNSLIIACKKKNEEIALMLIDANANCEANKYENSPLYYAQKYGLKKVVKKILFIKRKQPQDIIETLLLSNITYHNYELCVFIIENNLLPSTALKLLSSSTNRQNYFTNQKIVKALFKKATSGLISQLNNYNIFDYNTNEKTKLNGILNTIYGNFNEENEDESDTESDTEFIYD